MQMFNTVLYLSQRLLFLVANATSSANGFRKPLCANGWNIQNRHCYVIIYFSGVLSPNKTLRILNTNISTFGP